MSNAFDPANKREKIHWLDRLRSKRAADAWKQVATIGTRVIYHGAVHLVESHPGVNRSGEACVFISGVEEPVPLRLLSLAQEAAHA